MSLTSALNTARSIFSNAGTRSSNITTNIANASNSSYVRREAVTSVSDAGASIVSIARSENAALLRTLTSDISSSYGQLRYARGLLDLKTVLGGNDYETSSSSYLGKLSSALQIYRTTPSSTIAAQSVINAASDLSRSLNSASKAAQVIRDDADREIANGVDRVNGLLSAFKTTNDLVKAATASGTDASDALDRRDAVLTEIAMYLPVKSIARDNGDLVLTTNEGTILFETIPRSVSFNPTSTLAAGQAGNALYVDGVPLANGGTNPSGTLQALLGIRDVAAPTFQRQLDETARGLISAFAETSSVDGSLAPGLFTWSGGSVPGGFTDGLASALAINPSFVTDAGGNPFLIRDGGANGEDYIANSTGDAGFAGRLDPLLGKLGAKMSFDPLAGVGVNLTLSGFASASIGWLEGERSAATARAGAVTAALARSHEAYSNLTGVNLDEELMSLMEVEQSYKAGTKLLSVIDEMIKSLLAIK